MSKHFSSIQKIAKLIINLRGEKVLLDRDLAPLYNVETRVLKQAVRRNIERFPEDFMFEVSDEEIEFLVSQNVIPSKKHLGGSKPFAFTEQGVAMLSSVLKSKEAINVNIAIMRSFVQLRNLIASNKTLSKKVNALEAKYDEKFKIIFQTIRQLMIEAAKPKRRIGY